TRSRRSSSSACWAGETLSVGGELTPASSGLSRMDGAATRFRGQWPRWRPPEIRIAAHPSALARQRPSVRPQPRSSARRWRSSRHSSPGTSATWTVQSSEPLVMKAKRDPSGAAARPTVLFACVHNAGRSQMAAGLMTHLAGDRVVVRSAGSDPADQINPAAIEAMREVGVDISTETPKPLEADAVRESDVVVTMGCGDECPFYPGKRYVDWE